MPNVEFKQPFKIVVYAGGTAIGSIKQRTDDLFHFKPHQQPALTYKLPSWGFADPDLDVLKTQIRDVLENE